MTAILTKKLTAAALCVGMLFFNVPLAVTASEISGINPVGNVYNIEGDKFSGATQFRQYDKFNLSQGDIANLIYKSGYDKFVNLVDNQVFINGIVNTMRGNNFFNGHAIFVSPNGIVIGASGVLNVGSLTLMAPSQNAYNMFKNNYANSLSDFEFDLSKENYKSLIRNSSGDIIINGKIFARNDINAYGRRILTNVNPQDITKEANAQPGIFAGIQNKDEAITEETKADELFNSLVSNDTTNASGLALKDGKIKLITNKTNEELISYSTVSEEEKQTGKDDTPNSGNQKVKYETTTTIQVDTGLKTVEKKQVKDDSSNKNNDDSWASKIIDYITSKAKESDSNESTTRSIDYTYGKPTNDKSDSNSTASSLTGSNSNQNQNSSGKATVSKDTAFKTIKNSLSDNDSEIVINNAYIAANDVEIEANDASVKTVNASSIENFAKAVDEAIKSNNTDNSNKDNTNNNSNQNNNNLLSNNSNDTAGSNNNSGENNTEAKENKDETTGYQIHDRDYGTAPKASSKVEINNSQIFGNNISIKANAKGETETYIQLLTPIFEKWLNMLITNNVSTDITNVLTKAINKYADINIDLSTDEDLDNDVAKAISEYFSDGVYTYHDGGRAEAEIVIEDTILKAADTLTITSTAEANTKITTGKLDSHPVFLYGLGSTTSSNVKIANSTIKAGDNSTSVNINAYSKNNNSIDYDSSNFLSVTEKKEEQKPENNNQDSGNQDINNQNNDNSSNNNSGNNSNNNNDSNNDNNSNNNTDNKDDNQNDSGYSDSGNIYGGDSSNNTDSNTDNNNNDSSNNNNNDNDNTNNNSGDNKDKDKDKEKKYESTTSLYNLTLLNNSIISDTNVEIENSTIDANNLTVRAISNNKNNVKINNVSNVGKESDHSGVAVGLVINHTDTNANVKIKGSTLNLPTDKADKVETVTKGDGSTEDKTTTYGDARILAQNINQYSHTVETKVSPSVQTFEVKPKELANYDPSYTIAIYEKLNDKFLGKLTDKMSEGLDKANFELSGSAIWNHENNNASVLVDSLDKNISSITAKNIDISSDILDFTLNTAKTNASAKNNWGAGAAIIINDQNNTNTAKVTGKSELTASKSAKINAATQLPMNTLNIRLGNDIDGYKYVGLSFDQDEVGNFNPDLIYTDPKKFANLDFIKAAWGKIKSPRQTASEFELKMDGLFNNLAQSKASAQTADIAGSVVVNTINNNTDSIIDGQSRVNVTGDGGKLVVNAVNSAVSYNGVGDVQVLIEGINELIAKIKKDGSDKQKEEAGKFGVGGSVLIDNYTNNASAKIDNATATAVKGDVSVLSANEESYLNVAVTGGSASKLAIEGTVNIQNIDGTTKAFIENNSIVTAKNVNVKAGEAYVKTKKTNKEYGKDPIEFNGWEIKKNEERTASDKLLNIGIIATNAIQETVGTEGEGVSTSSSGFSVGASINIANVNKTVESYIDNSEIIAAEDINVTAKTGAWNLNFVEAGASAGGVSLNKAKQEETNKKNDENKKDETKTEEQKKTEEKEENGQSTKNVGNWMDMIDEAGDDEEDVMNLRDLFAENDASEQSQASLKDNKDAVKTSDKTVDKDGKEVSPTEKTGSDKKSNADVLTENSNKKLEGDENKKADTETASNNLSVAAAGAVSLIKDTTKTTAKITNSNKIKSGKEVDVSASKDTLALNINGGLAKSGNVAAGAGVNIYRDLSETKSYVDNSTITFTGENVKGLNVKSEDTEKLISVTAGAGAASNNEKNFKTAAGGSFGWNTLKNTVSSKLNNVTVKKENSSASPSVTVEAKDNTTIWNTTGGVAYAGGSNSTTGVGAGVAATVNYSSKDITAEVINSSLTDVGAVKINADLVQDYNTIAIAAALVTGAKSGYTFDGAVNTEVNTNEVTARGKSSAIKSNGDVSITANETVTNQSLAGGLDFSTSQSGVGVGIGAIVNVNNSDVKAEADSLTVQESGSVNINAAEKEVLKFLAANFGIQIGGATTVNVNGISNVFVSEVVGQAINNSVLNSTGKVAIDSDYNNSTSGITFTGSGSMDGSGIGANLIANVYNNHVTSELQKGSKISADGDVSISANALEELNMIPVGVALSNGGAAVAANINANVIVDTIKSIVHGNIEKSGSVNVEANDITSIKTRGGTLALSNSSSTVSGQVNVDVFDKKVTAEIKDAAINSAGNVNVFATSVNALGATKDSNGNYAPASLDYAKQYTAEDNNKNYKERSATDDDKQDAFADWNMFYDLSASFNASVSGAIVVKVIDNEVNSYIQNSIINADSLNVLARDNTAANAIIGRLSFGGTASVGANVFVLAGSSDVNSKVLNGSVLDIKNNIGIVADSAKRSTLISVAGGASATASVNGSAVANVINDTITAKIDDGVNIETGTLNINSNSNNDVKGLVVNASGAGTAAIGAVAYINKQNSENTSQIGTDGKNTTTIKAANNITVKSQADDMFSALLINANGAGGAAVGAMGLLNFVNSTVKSGIYNSNVTSEHGKVDVIADRGFNREEKTGENIFRSWFKDTAAYKKSGKFESNGTTKTKAEAVGENDIKSLKPKVGLFSVGAAGTAAVNASVISNKMEGTITSEVKNSNISSENGLNVQAKQNFANYDAMAAIAGAGNAAVNVSGVINLLEDTVTAQLDNTKVNNGGVNVDSKSVMEVNQVVLAGQGAGVGAAIGASVDVNKINDKVYAYVKNGSEIHGGTNVNAEHAVEINNILLGASIGGTGFAGNFIPLINKYTGTTIAQISNSNVNDGDINISANDYIDNFSAIAGIAGAGVGASMNGFLIKNDYENTAEASLKDITVNTDNNINISSSSVLDSENALLSAGITGVGANISVNVIINSVDSTVNSYIDNVVIAKAGDITLTANKDQNGNIFQDHIHNLTGNVGVAGVGAAASTNLIFNIYDNTTESYIKNTDIQKAANLTVEAHGDKRFEANNYGVTAAGLGGAALVDAVSNQIESETRAYVLANYKDKDGKAQDINVDNEVNVTADDRIISTSDMGFAAAGAGGAGANVNLSNYNEVVSAEILTDADNKVNAKQANIVSNIIYALRNTISGLAAGAGAIAGDVSIVHLGKREVIDDKDRENSKINETLSAVQKQYNKATSNKSDGDNPSGDGKFNAITSSKEKTGAIARVNGNLETSEDININSKTVLKGVDKDGNIIDTLSFDNLSIALGGVAAGVGVKLVDFSNSTDAQIAGGNIKAGGDININAESVNDVKMTSKQYSAAAGSISGAVGIYDNKALTNAKVTNADVEAKNVNINAKSSNKADVSSEAATLAAAAVNVSISKVVDKNVANAIVTGETNITADNLNLHATGNSDVSSSLQTLVVSGANISVLNSKVDETSVTNAIIKDVNGNINVSGLNLVASSDKLVASTSTNTTSVSGLNIGVTGSGANMNATMRAGIDSIKTQDDENGLTINNSGKTIILSGAKASDVQMNNLADLIENNSIKSAIAEAKAYIENKGFSLLDISVINAKAINNVVSNAIMKSDNHNASSLKMLAKIDEQAKAELSSFSVAAIGAGDSSLLTDITGTVGVDIAGTNTIANTVDIEVDSKVASSHSLESASFGVVSGRGLGMSADVNSNTTLNIGGELNADTVNIKTNTNRVSKIDYSSASGGGIAVTSARVNNNVRGNSVLNFNNYTPSKDYANKLNISHNSTNTQDTVSSSTSGGAVSVSSASVNGGLSSTTSLNIKNSDIKTNNDINIEVNNTNVVKDSASMVNGGVIAITTNNVSHTYGSGTKISVDNSKISAKNLIMKAVSKIKNAREDYWVEYRGASYGFIAKNDVKLTNNINQTSEIELKNGAEVNTDENVKLTVNTDSNFRQKIDSSGKGFAAVPKATTTLNADNTNKISIDEKSSIKAKKSAIFDFDSNNTLYTRSYSSAKHFAGDPTAKSYLTLKVNNELNNKGKVNSGSLVDINFMENSNNDLNQYARTEADAAVATSTQGGSLSRTYKNLISVAKNAIIASKKDIDINYASGKESVNSEISYRSTSYGLLGIPITVKGSWSSISGGSDHKLELNGEMAAGDGNNRYMKITSDGKIDLSTLKGFDDDNYSLSEDIIDEGDNKKDQTIKILQARIDEINSQIEALSAAIKAKESAIVLIGELVKDINDMQNELNNPDYTQKTLEEFEKAGNDDYKALVKQALIDNNAGTADYETIANDYIAYVKDMRAKIEQANDKFLTDGTQPAVTEADIMNITRFINSKKDNDTYKNLTEQQIKILADNREIVENRLTQTAKGNYNVYNGKYILVPSITVPDETSSTGYKEMKETDALVWAKSLLEQQLTVLEKNKANDEQEKNLLTKNWQTQTDNLLTIIFTQDSLYDVPYFVELADIASEASGIYINGNISDINDITGSGTFNIDSPALTIDNYSPRSVMLNSVIFGSDKANGLIINGKGYADYLNDTTKVIGTNTGVHYVSKGIGGNGDITITNYYDVLNPFAGSLNVPNNLHSADIIMQKPISTTGKLNLYNDSGDIIVLSDVESGTKHLVSTSGNVQIMPYNKFTFKEDDSIFAGNSVRIAANEADIEGTIQVGYKERKLVITDDMLKQENLVLDPTTGETNMINLGDTPYLGDANGNNIKAVYKDGQVYVFGVDASIGYVDMDIQSGAISPKIITKIGGNPITIKNETDKMVNIQNILNIASYGKILQSGDADYSGIQHELTNLPNQAGAININSGGGINFNADIYNESGNLNITNKNGDITLFGETLVLSGDIIVSQNNGNIVNGTVDTVVGAKHLSDDAGNLNSLYKLNFGTVRNIVINVTDGDIGVNSNPNAAVGIDASTRDYTDSINVKAIGTVTATAKNSTKTDNRLVNIRGYYSDLNLKDITSDGDVMLTASDWTQADVKPTPENDEDYFTGYSILDASENGTPIKGKNVSLISSNTIGTADKKMVINQDTQSGVKKLSMEAENNIYADIKSNSDNMTYIDAIISKRGDIDLTGYANTSINHITSGGHLHILEAGKELIIYEIGGAAGHLAGMDDILYPHDDIGIGSGENAAVPQSIAIEVLDALGGDNAESTLKIYCANVQGRNNGEGEYDANGRQIADVSLMADNIYVNSANAKHAQVSTKKNSQGLMYSDNSYTDAQLGSLGDTVYKAQGINAYGDGTALVLDVKGVSNEFVNENTTGATRTNYNVQSPVAQDAKFVNVNNQISDHDYRVNNAVISVNNNSSTNRNVVMNSIYADDAYIDSNAAELSVLDGYINNYAEFRNENKKAIVDNDFRRRLKPADSQLYTSKTGSFALGLDSSINMKTTAPIVGNDFDMLANNYQSEGNFVNRSRKDSKTLDDNVNKYNKLEKLDYHEDLKRTSMRFDTSKDPNLKSNVKIYDLSTTGALIKNDKNLKIGDNTVVHIAFDDIDVLLNSKVISIEGSKAGVEFLDITPDIANKILYRYMQQSNSMKSNLELTAL